MEHVFDFMMVLGNAPSINPLGNWINKEVGTAIGIIVLLIGCIKWATGKYGHMIPLFIVGGLMFMVSKGPETVFNALAGIWQLIFGG
ncbi:TcpD family membrane protein [Staphylococcus aureus]|uniref:TcpD family membrane protein n=1 Tax=Staphylococcus aureus TaxID=1280 RepID=UPI001BFDBC8E|nr:TcpD family membrane protein [Staphylococcus aureus]